MSDSDDHKVRVRIGHVRFRVLDLERAIRFYSGILHLRLVERVGGTFAFLSGSDSHHDVALQLAEVDSPGPAPHATGVDHVAFEVQGKKEFARAYKAAAEAGVEVTTIDNGVSWAMYFPDPEGNRLELFCDNRTRPGGRELWRGESRDLPPEEILAEPTD
jgi:catechol 2,3-dioxygenase